MALLLSPSGWRYERVPRHWRRGDRTLAAWRQPWQRPLRSSLQSFQTLSQGIDAAVRVIGIEPTALAHHPRPPGPVDREAPRIDRIESGSPLGSTVYRGRALGASRPQGP